jgi:hypothetical protein
MVGRVRAGDLIGCLLLHPSWGRPDQIGGGPMMPADHLWQPIRYLVFSASLRRDSLNSRLAHLAAAVIEANGGTVDAATTRDFDTPSYAA